MKTLKTRKSLTSPKSTDPKSPKAARPLNRAAVPVLTVYLWVIMTIFGAVILETFMVYPNVFHDPPASLETTMDFLAVAGPDDFFPPLGFASWVLGAAALVLNWRLPAVRRLVLLSLVMLVAEGVVSMLYFWPRNTIMFSEGLAVHSADYLRQVADEFVTWHPRSRMVFNTAAAVAAFAGFMKAYRYRITGGGGTGSVSAEEQP